MFSSEAGGEISPSPGLGNRRSSRPFHIANSGSLPVSRAEHATGRRKTADTQRAEGGTIEAAPGRGNAPGGRARRSQRPSFVFSPCVNRPASCH